MTVHEPRPARRAPGLALAFRVLSKGLEYAISVFVAALPADGFALLRELAAIDDFDLRRIVRSNLGKSRLSWIRR